MPERISGRRGPRSGEEVLKDEPLKQGSSERLQDAEERFLQGSLWAAEGGAYASECCRQLIFVLGMLRNLARRLNLMGAQFLPPLYLKRVGCADFRATTGAICLTYPVELLPWLLRIYAAETSLASSTIASSGCAKPIYGVVISSGFATVAAV
jgi:hypothetical protein